MVESTRDTRDAHDAQGTPGARRIGIGELFPMRLLGMGLYFAWTLLVPAFEQDFGVEGFSSSIARLYVFAAICAVVLVVLAWRSRSAQAAPFSRRFVVAAGACACLAPACDLVGLALPAGGFLLDVCALVLRGAADAGLFLAWSAQLATHRAYVAWVAYAGSFALASGLYFLASAFGIVAVTVAVFVLPAASCALLLASQALPREETVPEERRVAWKLPWRPVILVAAFAFAFNLVGHFDGNIAVASELGRLAVAAVMLVCFLVAFDRFDGTLLCKLSPVFMIAGLLMCGIPLAADVPVLRGLLVSGGYYGFLLYLYLTLNSVCYRFGVPAAWPFGVAQAACLVASIPGSVAGEWLGGIAAEQPMVVLVAMDACATGIALLGMLLLTGKTPATTWGIKAARMTSAGDFGAAAQAGSEAEADGPGSFGDAGSGGRAEARALDGRSYLESHVLRCALVARHYGLTHREEEVLSLIAQGESFQQIEANLSIAHGTMRAHVQHIYSKLGVHSYEEARAVVERWHA